MLQVHFAPIIEPHILEESWSLRAVMQVKDAGHKEMEGKFTAKSVVSPLDSSLNPAGDGAQLLLSAQVFISQF